MRFESSAPDLTHQLNFQSAVQGSGESLRQWSDRVHTCLRAFRISRAVSENWRESVRNGCMCSLTRLGVLHPQGRGRGQESPRLLQMRRSRSLPVELPRRPQRNRGPSPQIKGADEQRSGTGDQKRCGCSPQSMLSQQQSPRIPGSLPLAVWIASPTSPDFGLRGHLSF